MKKNGHDLIDLLIMMQLFRRLSWNKQRGSRLKHVEKREGLGGNFGGNLDIKMRFRVCVDIDINNLI